MKAPTDKQRKWGAKSWDYVTAFYEESTRDGLGDFTPMLRLIDHIKTRSDVDTLSAGISLASLIVASAAHVDAPNALDDAAPSICVTLRGSEFEFRDAQGRRRKCPIEDGNSVFDIHLVRLQTLTNAHDDREDHKQQTR